MTADTKSLSERLEEAKANLARLEREAASATCIDLGHDWQSLGGCNCGCHETAQCSVPVYICRRCKDCDYGTNQEAIEIRQRCALDGPPA